MDSLKLPFEIAELIYKRLKNESIQKEELRLQAWLDETDSNKMLYQRIIDEGNIEEKMKRYESYNKQEAWMKIQNEIQTVDNVRKTSINVFIRYAAIIIILITVGGYFLLKDKYFADNEQYAEKLMIQPGTQKAVLTLANGEKIELNNKQVKKLISQQQIDIVDANNTLIYQKNEEKIENIEPVIAFNTLETPRGGEYSVVLSDGTKIWLNAASKLKYPTEFIGDNRTVEIEGEAYFEVARDGSKPFIVKSNEIEISVLGTSFNVTTYQEDANIKTTLVEGKVKIRNRNKRQNEFVYLKPGYQAVLSRWSGDFEIIKVDTEIYTAWKDGKFVFSRETLQSIMLKLERWYNFETEYADNEIKNYHFSGTLKRYDKITDILKMLELTTQIKFEIDDKVVKVRKVNG